MTPLQAAQHARSTPRVLDPSKSSCSAMPTGQKARQREELCAGTNTHWPKHLTTGNVRCSSDR